MSTSSVDQQGLVQNQELIESKITNETIKTVESTSESTTQSELTTQSESTTQSELTTTEPRTTEQINQQNNGSEYKFVNKYILWAHSTTKTDWSIDSFDKVTEITNVSEFWRLANNFHKFDYDSQHYFLMKEGVIPLWEHSTNKNGGICSFKSNIEDGVDMFTFLSIMMALGKVTNDANDSSDINGVSMSPHYNFMLVKIWCNNYENKIVEKLNPSIANKYTDISIMYLKNNEKQTVPK